MTDDRKNPQRAARLLEIAEMLGSSTTVFYDAAAGERMLQLLRLWDALPDADAEEAALSAIRSIVKAHSVDVSSRP